MAAELSTLAAAAAECPSLVRALDEDAQAEVLRVAKISLVLAALASSSKQLCRVARSRVPVKLQVRTAAHAELVVRSHAAGRPPFSACTELDVNVDSPAEGLIAVGVFNAAQQWAALQQLRLTVRLMAEQLQPRQTLDYCTFGLLGALPALKQLRQLVLHAPDLGPCSTRQLAQLVQLTGLELCLRGPTAAAAAAAGPAVPANLWSLTTMTNLVELVLAAAPVPPAAGAEGPFCFPSSLTRLSIRPGQIGTRPYPEATAWYLTHLPGCLNLQKLELWYHKQEHPSTHPSAVVAVLAQHNTRLRVLSFRSDYGPEGVTWDAQVPGLPAAAAPVDREWHPDASLASLRGLECLHGGAYLCVHDKPAWQYLAQLAALSQLSAAKVTFVPSPSAGLTLSVLELKHCLLRLGGQGIGRLLLACPHLLQAHVVVEEPPTAAALPDAVPRLARHPSLKSLELWGCSSWGEAAPTHFAALAPVLADVSLLDLVTWPSSATSQPRGNLPDLSPCTALQWLSLDCQQVPPGGPGVLPEQEDFLAMLAPLVQLRHVEVCDAPRLTFRVALVLQHMLPQLQELTLCDCGKEVPLAAATDRRQGYEEVLGKVKLLLRPGLQLSMY